MHNHPCFPSSRCSGLIQMCVLCVSVCVCLCLYEKHNYFCVYQETVNFRQQTVELPVLGGGSRQAEISNRAKVMRSCSHHKTQHWYTIEANDNRISLLLLLLVLLLLPLLLVLCCPPLTFLYFSSTKKIKRK